MDADKVFEESLKELGKAAAKEAWDKKGKIREIWSRVPKWLGFSKRDVATGDAVPQGGILILGLAGSGKTTLARLLSGEVEIYIDPPETYLSSLGIEEYTLLGEPDVEIVVPPGQENSRAATWDDLLKDATVGRFRGLILVTAYGHESIARQSYKDHPLYESRKDSFVQALLERQRQDEIALLDRLVPILQQVPKKFWCLSVITKQDLWWPDHAEVEKFLHDGVYREWLERLGPLRHEACSLSLVIQNWETREHETLKPNAAGYDSAKQRESIQRLFEILDALRRWEETP